MWKRRLPCLWTDTEQQTSLSIPPKPDHAPDQANDFWEPTIPGSCLFDDARVCEGSLLLYPS